MARAEVAYSPRPGEVDVTAIEVGADATILQALQASGLLQRHPEIDLGALAVGVWGEVVPLSTPVRDGDRVEVYRPLVIDPKEARRLRYRKQRAASR